MKRITVLVLVVIVMSSGQAMAQDSLLTPPEVRPDDTTYYACVIVYLIYGITNISDDVNEIFLNVPIQSSGNEESLSINRYQEWSPNPKHQGAIESMMRMVQDGDSVPIAILDKQIIRLLNEGRVNAIEHLPGLTSGKDRISVFIPRAYVNDFMVKAQMLKSVREVERSVPYDRIGLKTIRKAIILFDEKSEQSQSLKED